MHKKIKTVKHIEKIPVFNSGKLKVILIECMKSDAKSIDIIVICKHWILMRPKLRCLGCFNGRAGVRGEGINNMFMVTFHSEVTGDNVENWKIRTATWACNLRIRSKWQKNQLRDLKVVAFWRAWNPRVGAVPWGAWKIFVANHIESVAALKFKHNNTDNHRNQKALSEEQGWLRERDQGWEH